MIESQDWEMVVRSPQMFHWWTRKETGLLENYTSPPLKLKCKITGDQVAQQQWPDYVPTVIAGGAAEDDCQFYVRRPSNTRYLQ